MNEYPTLLLTPDFPNKWAIKTQWLRGEPWEYEIREIEPGVFVVTDKVTLMRLYVGMAPVAVFRSNAPF